MDLISIYFLLVFPLTNDIYVPFLMPFFKISSSYSSIVNFNLAFLNFIDLSIAISINKDK